MLGVRGSWARRMWAIGSARFCRDVSVSVLATGIAGIAFSQLSREPGLPSRAEISGKSTERLAAQPEMAQTRSTQIYDTLAMFGLPHTDGTAWREVPTERSAATEAASKPSRAEAALPRMVRADRDQQRRIAALPPSRPHGLTIATPAEVTAPVEPGASEPAEQKGRPVRLLGWTIPGSDALPSLPDGGEAWKKVASLGGAVADFGDTVVKTVGLK